MVTTWVPAYLKDMGAWIQNPGMYMYGRWDNPPSKMEGGVDLTGHGGDPVYALGDGPIIGAGYFWHSANLYTPGSGNPGYGVVTQRVNIPGYGLNDLYYQHIDINPNIQTCYANNCGSQYLKRGDIVGWVRANVGEIEMGINANWGGVWGVNHPGPWANDPRPMILALMQLGVPPNIGSQPTLDTSFLGLGFGNTPLVNSEYVTLLDDLATASIESNFLLRATLAVLGILIVGVGLVKITGE